MAGLQVILLVNLLATLRIGGARVGRRVIPLNATGIDPTPHVTTDTDHILLTTITIIDTDLDLHIVGPLSEGMTGRTHLTTQGITHQMTDTIEDLHIVGPLSAGMTGRTHLTTQGITHQMTDTIEDTTIALYLAVLLHVGLGGVFHEASPLAHGGGGPQGGVILEASPLAHGGGPQGEAAIHAVHPLHQGGVIHEASPLAQGGAQREAAIHAVNSVHQGGARGVILEALHQG